MAWTRRFGIGPWFYWEHLGGRDYRFRGEPAEPDVSTAMADWNGLQIQLVQQHDDSPSPHPECPAAPAGAPGLAHIAVPVPAFSAEAARRTAAGETALSEAGSPVSNVFYHDGDWNLPAIEMSERRSPS